MPARKRTSVASVPGTAKRGIGAGGVLAVLLVIALALGAGHHHLAVSSGQGGGAHVIPHLVGTPGDPCQHKPDDHEVMLIHVPGRSLHGHVMLDCGEWREIVRRAVERGTGGRATIRQILACIQATVHRGDWARNADSYAWHWG